MFQWARNALGRFAGVGALQEQVASLQTRLRAKSETQILARYDNSITTPSNIRDWWLQDYMSARSANNYQVRRQLRMRSRYELSNNPYLFGIVNSNADDLIDTGPTLQLATDNDAYNQEVETAWQEWCAEVKYTEKLRTIKRAKTVDGEGFLILKNSPRLKNPVKLYPVDVEADQVTAISDQITDMAELWLDGITLDEVGNPISYTVLRTHPGDYFYPNLNPYRADKIAARWIIHWFHKFRPSMVRGVPMFTPSLDLFVDQRTMRKSTVQNAKIAAQHTSVIESEAPAWNDTLDAEWEDFERIPIDTGMQTMLPKGYKLNSYPTTPLLSNYEMFSEKNLGEAIRPLSYPLNAALGTSQKFNFSSTKLDFVNYRKSLRIERKQCDGICNTPTFREWFYEAIRVGRVSRWNGSNEVPPHDWHWPPFERLEPLVDIQAELAALAGGLKTHQQSWAEAGEDWKEMFKQMGEEQKLREKYNLQFGEPLKQTDRMDDEGENGKPKNGKPQKAEAMYSWLGRQHLNGEGHYDPSQPRDENGEWASAGGTFEDVKHGIPEEHHEKAKGVFGKMRDAAFNAAVKLSAKLGALAPDVLDTAHDYSKLFYAGHVGEGSTSPDPFSQHLGIGANTVATIASHVLTRASRWLRSKLAGAMPMGFKESEVAAVVKAIEDILRAVHDSTGKAELPKPSAEEIEKWLRESRLVMRSSSWMEADLSDLGPMLAGNP